MSDLPLVSICIITYNSAEFVLETLNSAKKQSYQNVELMISDDASSDSTIEICKKWLEENSNYFVRTELISVKNNTGIPANCNRAVKAARGKWIKLIAGDDILLPDCISDNIDYVTHHPETQVLFSALMPFNVFNGEKHFLDPVKLPQSFLGLDAGQQFVEIIFGKMEGVTPTAFIAKSLFEKLNYYDEEYKLAEDYPFWLKCTSNAYRFVSIDTTTVLYRHHTNNTGVAKEVNGTLFKDRVKIFRQYMNRINANEDSKAAFAKYYQANYFSFIKFCNASENLELLRNVKGTKKVSRTFYLLVRMYMSVFPKNTFTARLLRSLYYRMLILLN